PQRRGAGGEGDAADSEAEAPGRVAVRRLQPQVVAFGRVGDRVGGGADAPGERVGGKEEHHQREESAHVEGTRSGDFPCTPSGRVDGKVAFRHGRSRWACRSRASARSSAEAGGRSGGPLRYARGATGRIRSVTRARTCERRSSSSETTRSVRSRSAMATTHAVAAGNS